MNRLVLFALATLIGFGLLTLSHGILLDYVSAQSENEWGQKRMGSGLRYYASFFGGVCRTPGFNAVTRASSLLSCVHFSFGYAIRCAERLAFP